MCLTDTVSLCEMYPVSVSLCPYVKLIIDFQLPYCYLSLELLQHPIFVCNSNTLLLCFMLSLFKITDGPILYHLCDDKL